MNGIILTFIYLPLLFFKTAEPTKTPHFYWYLKGYDKTNYILEKGKYQISADKLTKLQDHKERTIWLSDIRQMIDSLPEGKKDVLFYIHGYMADNPAFVKESGYVLQKEYFDHKDSPYAFVISLQWDAPADYRRSRSVALEKGTHFAVLVNDLYKIFEEQGIAPEFSFFCHSMGNRVFEGLYDSLITINPDIHLDKVFLMAADLESDIFNDRFSTMPAVANRIYIYNNLNDRTLAMANAFVPYKRLGIFGPEKSSCQNDNIQTVDVSDMDDDETLAGRMSLHRYYYDSPMVRSKIRNQMAAQVVINR
jgi:hypothetical protein